MQIRFAAATPASWLATVDQRVTTGVAILAAVVTLLGLQ